jgi:hypothetical protein
MSDEQAVKAMEPEGEAASAPAEKEPEGGEREEGRWSGSMGIVQGIPGRRIKSVGVLDVRGVAAEQIARIESLKSIGVVLVDESCRSALEGASMVSVGAVAVVEPDVRVLVESCLEISRVTMEGMPAGQKLLLVGIVFFKPDVPPALVAEKFESLQVVGVLLAPAGVQGALIGKMQIIGVSVTLPDDVGPVIRSIGQTFADQKYLSYLEDGVTYLNIGRTRFAEDVTEALLAQKISAYYNVGQTLAPPPLLALLKARCPTNLGQFAEPKAREEAAPPS